MANSSDLDDFFKKKDRKSSKNKKQSGILTNNEELLKQLVSVTSATTSFKENFDLIEDEDDGYPYDENNRPSADPNVSSTNPTKTSQTTKIKAADVNTDRFNSNNQQQPQQQQPQQLQSQPQAQQQQPQQQQQDEWEEYEDSSWKYDEMRARFSRSNPNDDDYDDGDNSDDSMSRAENNDNLDQREQQKDKPVWKIDQIKTAAADEPANPVEEKGNAPPVQPSVGAYRPPQRRGVPTATGEVTIVSGSQQRPTIKKKQPNLASTEEFPSLGAAITKK